MNTYNLPWRGLPFGVGLMSVLFLASECNGQIPPGASGRVNVDPITGQVTGASFGGIVPGTEKSGGYEIPDVENKLSLASLLFNRSVVESLGLSDDGVRRINDFRGENGASFNTKVYVPPRNGRIIGEDVHTVTKAHRVKSKKFLGELISSEQWIRLRQIAYQVEVGRIGLANALIRGRLGADTGIRGQQLDSIRKKSEEAEARAKADIEKIHPQILEEALAALTPEQRKKAEQLVHEHVVSKAEAEASKTYALRILARKQDEMLAALTHEQQKTAKELLGEPIIFVDQW
ncbi:MAG: hypothetical protein ABI557_06985 [Aureliella sp.]